MNEVKKIGLFGFGTVGKGFYEILKNQSGIAATIEKICIKRLDLERIGHELRFTDDSSEILDDPEVDIVVELISDPEAAKEIVYNALSSGKSVISANKKMIADSLDEVQKWHQEFEKPFLYEAAVGGGIPIVHTMDSYFRDFEVTKIQGILNGSSNYILTLMQEKNWPFEEALEAAQTKGFAEANPSLDIGGFDASYKLSILAYHAFDQVVHLNSSELENITNVTLQDIKTAKKHGKRIKPIAQIEKLIDGFHCSVKPTALDISSKLYNVNYENNAISIETNSTGNQMLVGKGAGAFPTGAAVLADLKRVLNGIRYQTGKPTIMNLPSRNGCL